MFVPLPLAWCRRLLWCTALRWQQEQGQQQEDGRAGRRGGVIGASAAPVAASAAMPTSEPGLSPCVEELSAGRLGCPAGLDHERAARAAEGSAGPSSGLIARRRKLVISDAGPVSPKKSKTVLSACTLQSANDSAARALDSSRHGGTADPES